jgi:hypothetical protein
LRSSLSTVAELRTPLALAEERLTDLKAMLGDMRRDRDAWRKRKLDGMCAKNMGTLAAEPMND